MTKPDDREPFRLANALELIAGTALGMVIIRTYYSSPVRMIPFAAWASAGPGATVTSTANSQFRDLAAALAGLLPAWSPVILWCARKQGRRRVGMIIERPGLLACILTILILPFGFFQNVGFEFTTPRGITPRLPEPAGLVAIFTLTFLKRKVGVCVILGWIALIATRSRRNPIGWVEWSGLAIGIGWIAAWLAYLAFG